jgi:glycosyltransferase involved in cell wall biosynthesis
MAIISEQPPPKPQHRADRGSQTLALRAPLVEVVVPVYNEQAALEHSIRRLHSFLEANLPWAWRIVIADNASTDRTLEVADRLSRELDRTHVLHLDEKGRGRALRAAWSVSPADVLCYMDVDLSTDLRALLPLLAGIVSGHCELAIGSRLAPGARIVRSRKRELISRAYNRILRLALQVGFSDAQCGFKAIRAEAARTLLPQVRDQGWFFDTELLVLAERHGMRIGEVAVDWVEDPDTRVDIIPTALDDLRGVLRLRLATPLARFLLIGALSTIAYALLYVALAPGIGDGGADALALAITALANTQANRRFTFRLRGRRRLARQYAAGGLLYALTLGLSLGALGVLHDAYRHPALALEVAVLVAAGALATGTRYMTLRNSAFSSRPAGSPASSLAGELGS